MTKIKVNDVWLIKELDNKEGVSNAYNYFLSQGICILASKACVLNFWKASSQGILRTLFPKRSPSWLCPVCVRIKPLSQMAYVWPFSTIVGHL